MMQPNVKVIPVFFHMVSHPAGEIRVGKPYLKKETAKGWTRFVRATWGLRVRIATCRVRFVDGVISEASRKELDEVYNCDPPDGLLDTGIGAVVA